MLLEIFRQARAACGPRALCWSALVNIMNFQMFMAKGHTCYCELVRWFAGSLVALGKITVNGKPNRLNCCVIFIVRTEVIKLAAGRVIQPGAPRVGDS